MALGDIYTEQEVDETIDQLLPVFNQDRPPEQQIPRDVVRTLVRAENMGSTGGITLANRKSPKDATGVMQVIPATIRGLKGKYLAPDFPEDLSNSPLSHQVMAGIATLREMVDRTKTTDWKNLAMQYNAGPEVAAGRKPLPEETKGYLLKGFKAREALGIQDTDLPPTASTAKASPAFSRTPLDAASSAYNTMQQLVPAVQSALFGSSVAAQEAGNNQIQAVQTAGQAAAESARLQAEITIDENNFHTKLLKAVGLDILDPEAALSQELRREADTRVKREALGKRIADMESVDFFSNPLKFLAIQGDLKTSIAQYNNMADVENRSNQEISRMQTLATTLKSLTPAKSADLIRSKAQKDAESLLSKAQFDAAQITERNAAGHAKNLLDQFTLQRNIFHDILQIEGRDFDTKFRMAQFDALMEQREINNTLKRETAEQKAIKDSQENALVTGINLYKKAIGGGNIDMTKEDIKRMPANMREAWYGVIMRGSYGNNYAQAVPFINTFGNAAQAASTGNAALVQTVRNIESQVIPRAQEIINKNKLANPLAPSIKEDTAREMAYAELYARDASLANKGAIKDNIPLASPYALDYNAIATVASKNPTTVVAKVLTDAKMRSPNQSLNGIMTPRMLVEAAKAKVVAGEVSPAVAAQEISNFFKQANDQQYEAAGLSYIGLPRFTDFNITPGARGGKPVDLYNPAQLENYLMSEVTREKRMRTIATPSFDLLWR